MKFLVPVDGTPKDTILPLNHYIFGTGDVLTATIDTADIGRFVAKIIDDPRTLNRQVFCYGEHKTQNETWSITKKIKEELRGGALDAVPRIVTIEELKSGQKAESFVESAMWEYMYSMFVRGDNTVENAQKHDYGAALDARVLYPDLAVTSLEEFVRRSYETGGAY